MVHLKRIALFISLFTSYVFIYVFYFSSQSSFSSDSIGMTLSRGTVLRTCKAEKSTRCEYLVMFGFDSRVRNEQNVVVLPDPSLYALPPQLTAHLTARSPSKLVDCPLNDLLTYVAHVVEVSQEYANKNSVLAEFPQALQSCFSGLDKNRKDSIIAINGEIPGAVKCLPDYNGVDSCEIMFVRQTFGLGHQKFIEDRLSISSFTKDEIIELLSNFPRFKDKGKTNLEVDFLSMLSWLSEILHPNVYQMN